MTSAIPTARLAGYLYVLLVLTGIFNLMYVPSQLFALGDPILNLEQIASARMLFASGVSAGLLSYVIFLCIPIVLYRILAPHGETSARLMVAMVVASIPLSFAALSELLDVLEMTETLPASAEPAYAALADTVVAKIRQNYDLQQVASILWGLWLFPLGVLAWKSRLVPRVLSGLLMLGCFGFLIEFFAPLFFEGFHGSLIETIVGAPASLGEIGTCLWLAFGPLKGFRSVPRS